MQTCPRFTLEQKWQELRDYLGLAATSSAAPARPSSASRIPAARPAPLTPRPVCSAPRLLRELSSRSVHGIYFQKAKPTTASTSVLWGPTLRLSWSSRLAFPKHTCNVKTRTGGWRLDFGAAVASPPVARDQRGAGFPSQ